MTAIEADDRRDNIRQSCSAPVRCLGIGGVREGKVLNISASGAMLALSERVRAGDRLRLEIGSQETSQPATVRWGVYNEDAGCWLVGCAFQQPLAEQLLHRVVKDHPLPVPTPVAAESPDRPDADPNPDPIAAAPVVAAVTPAAGSTPSSD